MINFEAAKEIERQKKAYNDFFIPTIIVNKEWDFFWSNKALKEDWALGEIDVDKIKKHGEENIDKLRKELETQKSAYIEKMYDEGLNSYSAEILPIIVDDEKEGYIIILLKQNPTSYNDVSLNNDLMNISNSIRQSISKIFAANDALWAKSDIYFRDENKAYLEKINLASYKVLRTSVNINTYIELNNGRQLNTELIDVAEWIKSVQLIINGLIADKKIEFEVKYTGTNILAQVDVELLEIAFCNIIHNSIYYSNNKNKISVLLSQKNDTISLTVSDEGVGFDKEKLQDANIFKPEAGIGLRLVSKIVSAHGGKIQIKTAPEKGTSIEIEIPANTLSGVARLAGRTENKELKDKFSVVYVGLTSAVEMPYFYENKN